MDKFPSICIKNVQTPEARPYPNIIAEYPLPAYDLFANLPWGGALVFEVGYHHRKKKSHN